MSGAGATQRVTAFLRKDPLRFQAASQNPRSAPLTGAFCPLVSSHPCHRGSRTDRVSPRTERGLAQGKLLIEFYCCPGIRDIKNLCPTNWPAGASVEVEFPQFYGTADRRARHDLTREMQPDPRTPVLGGTRRARRMLVVLIVKRGARGWTLGIWKGRHTAPR